jgi:hypothetical protein
MRRLKSSIARRIIQSDSLEGDPNHVTDENESWLVHPSVDVDIIRLQKTLKLVSLCPEAHRSTRRFKFAKVAASIAGGIAD